MSVISSDLKHYKSANNPSDDTSTVGGAISASEVGSSIGEIFHLRTAAEDEEGDTQYQYKKTFIKNTNADTDYISAVVYLKNSLDDVSGEGEGVVSAASSSASDGSTKKIKVVGEDDEALVITEEIELNGTSEVTGTETFSKVFWVELRLVSGGALTNAAGDISIEVDGVGIGMIPTGYNCAIGIVDVGLAGTLDDTDTTDDAVTAPSGISFSKPRTEATGIDVANSGTLSYGSGQGVWWRQTIEGGLAPAADLNIVVRTDGETT